MTNGPLELQLQIYDSTIGSHSFHLTEISTRIMTQYDDNTPIVPITTDSVGPHGKRRELGELGMMRRPEVEWVGYRPLDPQAGPVRPQNLAPTALVSCDIL